MRSNPAQRGSKTVKGVKTTFTSGCGSVVLVHEAAETIAAADVAARRLRDLFRFGRLKRESAVGAFAVVVLDVDGQDVFEVAAPDDQQPVTSNACSASTSTTTTARGRTARSNNGHPSPASNDTDRS